MTNDRRPQDQDKFVLRLPDGMRERIKERADRNGRSMNAEIVALLEREYPAPSDVLHVHLDNIRHALDLYERETDRLRQTKKATSKPEKIAP